ncbi:hypothetical protein [Ornithinibacillus californiensis]|uniref:hypothetical protein n=1 Tax=Ornithinibacillus californiensis TaxID=161536 RepID=UPI00064D85AB|nr:hypothetical protein [Ornithinibacillus californiensis]
MQKDDIRLALQLMKQELKVSWFSFIGLFLYFSLFSILFYTGFSAQGARFVGLDLFFIMLFVFGPIWFKAKGLQFQKISSSTWASPTVVLALSLPIQKQVIVIKSILMYLLSSLPYQLYMFVALYLISPTIRDMMEIDAYISLTIIWLSFGIYTGLGVLIIDIGSNTNVSKLTTFLSILLLLGVILLIFYFPFFFTYGVVEWTIIIANKWPFLSAIISIIAAVVGFNYWKSKMIKQFKQVDFL